MGKLTDIEIRNRIKKGERFDKWGDGDGLFLAFRPGYTVPVWRFRYKMGGKESVMRLGDYPETSLADARRMAKEYRAKLTLGHDPQGEVKQRKLESIAGRETDDMTVAKLADRYFADRIAGKVKHPNIPLARIERDIKPAIGKLPLELVTTDHIEDVLKGIVARGAPTTANDVLLLLRKMFDFAVRRKMLTYNVAAVLEIADAGGAESGRDRVLSEDEIATFFRALDVTKGMSIQNILTFKLLLLLCVRKQELTQARIAEFDLEQRVWSLPGERTKTGAAIDIPLPESACEALKTLMTMACGSSYLLPARKSQDRMLPHISDSTLNVALSKVRKLMPNMEIFTIHDLRRTARTQLSKLGVDSDVAERCLNHKIKGVRGIYDRHSYFEERRNALDRWAIRLEEVLH
jgi:integrase